MANIETFQKVVKQAVELFPNNELCQRIDKQSVLMKDYHSILLMLFHQTFEGPSTFALAGAHCHPSQYVIRDYLLQHADEERTHWQWIISDLKNTGYTGEDPRLLFPKPACQTYIAFNVYTAVRMPITRLATAAVLESIGAQYGKTYTKNLCKILKLDQSQAYFFYGHGDTDIGHTKDIFDLLNSASLSEKDWDWMCHAAQMAGNFYTAMYNEALLS